MADAFSDSGVLYAKKDFPQGGAITAQGELKKIRFDPIFSLNHTCAMLRAHLSRLIPKTSSEKMQFLAKR